MTLSTLKFFLWLITAGLGSGLGYIIWEVKTKQADWEAAGPTSEEMHRVCTVDEIDEVTRIDLVSTGDLQRVYHLPPTGMDWRGEPPPPPPVEVQEETGPVVVPKTPVADLLNVIFIRVRTSRPERSIVYIKYTDQRLAAAVARPGAEPTATLKQGDHLPAPFDYVRVEEIQTTGVLFAFDDDEEREHELVEPGTMDQISSIVPAPPGGAILPEDNTAAQIPISGDVWRPERTTLIGDSSYQLGVDDVADFGERYSEIITSEVRHGRWRDPQTGRWAGVQLYDVEGGGIIASHGGQSGDVIKSINGHPVTSASEAITYVKNNSETTSQWDVVVLRQGVEETLTFYSPPEE